MKKLLVILMVVAMASFLFVGCMPGVTPEPEPEPEPEPNEPPVITSTAITSGKVGVAYTYNVVATDPDEDTLTYSLTKKPLGMAIVATTGIISWIPTDAGEFEVGVKVSDPDGLSAAQDFVIMVAPADVTPPVIPTTQAPIIRTIPDIVGGFVNAARAANGIVVNGTAPTWSEVKVYINGICAGTGDAEANGEFSVVVANADLIKAGLKVDGAKTLYATATEPGKKESKKSIERKFTLDTVAPRIDSVAATAFDAGIVEAATRATPSGTHATDGAVIAFVAGDVEDGTWLITVLAAQGVALNVAVTHDGVTKLYTMVNAQDIPADLIIPGVPFKMEAALTATHDTLITCTALVADIVDRYTLKFDGPVDYTGAIAGTYEIFRLGISMIIADPVPYKTSNNTGYWNTLSAGALVLGDTVSFTVFGVTDLAGNPGGTAASPLIKSCDAGLASATSLAP